MAWRNLCLRSLAKSVVVVVGVGLLLGSCATKTTLRDQLEQIPAKHLEYYEFEATAKLVDRVSQIPDALLQLYSDADNVKLQPYVPSDNELQQISTVLGRLPERHQEVLGQRLIGIYCVDNFVGSGMSDWILGPNNEIYAVLVLHPRIFHMSAAELLTFRLNTAFGPDDSGTELFFDISNDVSALTYILLHESTHIVDYVDRYTPYVEPAMLELLGQSPQDAIFTKKVWTDYRKIAPTVTFPHQKNLRYYYLDGEPPLMHRDAKKVLAAFVGTPFASLYGSVNWAEDFAEFVTFYYLTHSLGAEYRIQVRQQGTVVFSHAPMSSSLVSGRSQLIDSALLQPAMQ